MSMSLNFEAMIKTIVGVEHIQETGESSIIKITRRIRDKFSSEFDTKVLSLLCELRRRHPYTRHQFPEGAESRRQPT